MTVSIVLGPINRGGTTAQFSATAEELLNNLDPWTVQVNALEVNVNAKEVSAVAAAAAALASQGNAATSAALAAGYAGAIAWVSGTTYSIGDKRWSLVNGFVYRRLTFGAGTTDPSLDATNWAVYSLATPVQVVSGLTQTAISGSAYALTNTTAQSASANICLYSEDLTAWLLTGSGSIGSNSTMSPDGYKTADTLTDSDVGFDSSHFSRQHTVPNDSNSYTSSVYLRQGSAASTRVNAYFVGGTTVVSGLIVTWGATPSIAAVAVGTNPVLTFVGNGWYRASITTQNNSTGNVSHQIRIYPAGDSAAVTGTVIAWGAQVEQASSVSSYMPSTATAGSRSAGIVSPSRLILPPSPAANDWVRTVVSNSILTNVIDPNGQTIEGQAGPITLDLGQPIDLQFINGTWKKV